jgi:hypothetical protein
MAHATFSSLNALFVCMAELGAVRVVAKPLSENDNTKQQIYLGGNFESLNVIPFGKVKEDAEPRTPNLKAAVALKWINNSGTAELAPHAKLILYPQYPEVRLSGFLSGCKESAPSALLQPVPRGARKFDNEPDGRVLLLGVSNDRSIYAYVSAAGTPVSREFEMRVAGGEFVNLGVFWQCSLDQGVEIDGRAELLRRLSAIKRKGWQWSRLLRGGLSVPYNATNGGGYTLEALLGITPNGLAEPDFMGWEVKACGSDRVTLMTPEPNGGYYGTHGVDAFLRKYGRRLENDSIYFTGTHRVGEICTTSGQELLLHGYQAGAKTFNALGYVQLVDDAGNVSASWSFAKLIQHWSKKHALAAYVLSAARTGPPRAYMFAGPALLGEGTDFLKLLRALSSKSIYYDPGPKLTDASSKNSKTHARSQFRIRVKQLALLYDKFESVPI